MRKKIMAVVLSCLTIFALVASSFAVTFSASAVSVDEMTKAAVQIISRSEGTYGTINPNDNGAVSIGMLQWHADRALQLMRSIANADTGSAQSILGSTFYNEVMTASSWNSRTFSAAEGTAASNLLTTAAGKSKQDALAYSDVQGYISAGQNLGISNAGVLVYYAELYNRGMGVARRILNAAANGGAYSSVTLSKLHSTALANSSSYYTSRLNNAYNTIVSLGWGDAAATPGGDNGSSGADTSDFSESYAGTYTVTASSLNVRSTPSTSGAKVGTLPSGAKVTVSSANGSWAAVSYNGISGYCSMDYLKQEAAQTTAPPQTTAPAETTTTAAPSDANFSESYAGTYSVTASSLNIRSAPSTSASKVGSIPNGAKVTVTAADGKWAAVSHNGVSGYCSMDYLKQESAQTTATTTAAPEETTTTTTTTTAAPDTTAPAETTAAPTTTTDIDMGRGRELCFALRRCQLRWHDRYSGCRSAAKVSERQRTAELHAARQCGLPEGQRTDNTDVTVIMQYLLRSFTSAGCITRQNNKTDKTTNAVPGVIWVQRFFVLGCVWCRGVIGFELAGFGVDLT